MCAGICRNKCHPDSACHWKQFKRAALSYFCEFKSLVFLQRFLLQQKEGKKKTWEMEVELFSVKALAAFCVIYKGFRGWTGLLGPGIKITLWDDPPRLFVHL